MAYTTIDDPAIYFNTVVYTGNDSTQSITGVGFQPDLVWGKNRATATHHAWQDSVRGNTKVIKSSKTDAETTITNMVTSFDSDGFSLGSDSDMNEGSGKSMVAWCWKETATAGFDIVLYTGNATARTISHSLSAVPKWIVVKNRSSVHDWRNYHASLGATHNIYFGPNQGAADDSTTPWNDTEPTSSVFTVGTANGTNQNTDSMIAYLWSEKKGFSKFGSYIGNATGNGGGPFVYTGFKPAWVMIKNASAGSTDWLIFDNKRGGPVASYYGNNNKFFLKTNATAAEANETFDMYSNGFKIKITNNFLNGDGNTLIYMAFAESPFVNSKGIPTTAR